MSPTHILESELAELHDTYRHLHQHPELSMQEHETAAFIEQRLETLGVEHFRCGGTGVVGVLRNGAGPVVAFRADTDGLPIQEDTSAEYRSTATGVLPDGTAVPVMHGCGHDSHVAAALTAIRIMQREEAAWRGTIVWIFQPGEETAAGAAAMVADGLWDRAPVPEIVFGQHVVSDVPTGTVGIASGNAMAMADSLRVTVRGRQSHGSQPQDSIDPIVLGAHMVVRLQTIVSRELSPQEPAVVTCGTFHAGLKENIIPDRAEFTLNIRTLGDATRERVLSAITRILDAEAMAAGAPAPEIEELYRFPLLVNDPDATARVVSALRGELGETQLAELPAAMGSEDFGWLAAAAGVPNVYWVFGAYPAETVSPPVNHSPFFLPELEPTLSTGVRAAVSVLQGALGGRA